MRRNLIDDMLITQQRLTPLPPPHDYRGFYTVSQLAGQLAQTICTRKADVLRNLGWTRTVRKINGVTQRVWFPPIPTQEK